MKRGRALCLRADEVVDWLSNSETRARVSPEYQVAADARSTHAAARSPTRGGDAPDEPLPSGSEVVRGLRAVHDSAAEMIVELGGAQANPEYHRCDQPAAHGRGRDSVVIVQLGGAHANPEYHRRGQPTAHGCCPHSHR